MATDSRQPDYSESQQERLQKKIYDQLYFDKDLELTDGVMNYIGRKISLWLLSRYQVKRRRR